MPNLKIAILIDGGFLRVAAKKAKKTYDPDFIEAFAKGCATADEDIFAYCITIALRMVAR